MTCQSCPAVPATPATFRFHIGMLIAREWHARAGQWCRCCLRRHYWDTQLKNATLGWWGYQSFFATWWALAKNTWTYVKACRQLTSSGRMLPAAGPR
jgi:hypothetical protein